MMKIEKKIIIKKLDFSCQKQVCSTVPTKISKECILHLIFNTLCILRKFVKMMKKTQNLKYLVRKILNAFSNNPVQWL